MSIVDVAKLAGVSQATVSRVINGRAGVSPERAAKVRQVMDQLGYQPPPLEQRPGRRPKLDVEKAPRAQAAQDLKNGLIGVVILDALFHYTPGVLSAHIRGIERGAADYGLGVVVMYADQQTVLSPLIAADRLDGLILMGSDTSAPVMAMLNRLPAIWSSSHHGPASDTVLTGNYQIGNLAADYLLARGHRRLGFLSAMAQYPAYPARAEAFESAAQRAGVEVRLWLDDQPLSLTGQDHELTQIRTAVDALVGQLAAEQPLVSGLFVPNDMMTAVVYAALSSRGIAPGKDVEIISCNNEETYLVGLRPRPATIDIGAELMGRKSVEQLLWRIHNPRLARQVHMAVEPMLVEGGAW